MEGIQPADFFSPDPGKGRASTEQDFQWMADWGFDFVRLPMAYPSYLEFDRSRAITPEEVYSLNEEALERIDQLVYLAHKYHLHVSLNLHRAPGIASMPDFMSPTIYGRTRKPRKRFTGTGACGPNAIRESHGIRSALIYSTSRP
jgi:endoglucanase